MTDVEKDHLCRESKEEKKGQGAEKKGQLST